MNYTVRPFLSVIDRDAKLRTWLELHDGPLMKQLATYRKNMGDGCNFVRGCLTCLWANAVARNREEFYVRLREAGYSH